MELKHIPLVINNIISKHKTVYNTSTYYENEVCNLNETILHR